MPPTLSEIAAAHHTLAQARGGPTKQTKRDLAESHVKNVLGDDLDFKLPKAEDDDSYYFDADGHTFHVHPEVQGMRDDAQPSRLYLVTGTGKSRVERFIGSIEDLGGYLADDAEAGA